MVFIVRSSRPREFTPAPEGEHLCVFVDIIDRGEQSTRYGARKQAELRWQTERLMDNGKPYLITFWANPTLGTGFTGTKSKLLVLLESWRGSAMTEEEKENFDVETLLGKNCLITVQHYLTLAGKVRGRIVRNNDAGSGRIYQIQPAPKGSIKLFPREYIRYSQREAKPEVKPSYQDDEEEVPF